MKHTKETRNYGPYIGKKSVKRSCPWGSPDIRLRLKLLNTVKEPKDITSKEFKESMKTISHQIENTNKETNFFI